MAFINKLNSGVTTPALNTGTNAQANEGGSFEDLLKKEINETNTLVQNAEKVEADMAAGNVEDLAKAGITIQKAEMKMKMMLEVRNKAINAYKELLKTQI
ncbi:MAG: flagellar hook-basal body complex protein FliE [Epsilonproteobacteria bacterium]|nr:flagellar hook-basal body complex protein FliE [Campylobacterota bacterium]